MYLHASKCLRPLVAVVGETSRCADMSRKGRMVRVGGESSEKDMSTNGIAVSISNYNSRLTYCLFFSGRYNLQEWVFGTDNPSGKSRRVKITDIC